MLAMSILDTPGSAFLPLLPQLWATAFGLWNTKPDCVGVSAKSIVTPASSSRLSAGRNILTPRCSYTASPGCGADSMLNSPASPEHPKAALGAAAEAQHAPDELLCC